MIVNNNLPYKMAHIQTSEPVTEDEEVQADDLVRTLPNKDIDSGMVDKVDIDTLGLVLLDGTL